MVHLTHHPSWTNYFILSDHIATLSTSLSLFMQNLQLEMW